jgi:hypothetical protein
MTFPDRFSILLVALLYAVLFPFFLPNVWGYFETMFSFPAIKTAFLLILPIWLFLHLCRLMIPAGKRR